MAQPKLLQKPWGENGLKNDIPTNRVSGVAQEAATYNDGFPSITMTPISLGGKPPSGKDMNGVLHELSSHVVYGCRGERYRFNQTYCTAIGGYPKGAVLMNDDATAEYMSLVDRNTVNFNLAPANINSYWMITSAVAKVDKTITITAGNGLTGGGNLTANRTLTMGTPSSITATSTNSVTAESHTHAIDKATTTQAGIVQLNDTLTSTSTTQALTAAQGKTLKDMMDAGGVSDPVVANDLNAINGSCYFRFPANALNGSSDWVGADGVGIQIAHPWQTTQIASSGGGNLHIRNKDNNIDWGEWIRFLTIENGVMLTGDQTIAGKKTFSGWTDFATGLRVSTSSKDSWADFGMGPSDVYIKNPISSKVLQLKDDGTLSYSNVKIMLATDRSDAVDLDDTNKLATAKGLKKAYDRGVESAPAGCVNYFAQSTAPTGWLKANGAAVSRTTYADLFSAIGTTFGAGNGTTTFNLPDLRGEFPRGWDDGRGVDAGRVFGSSQADAIQAWTAKMTVQRAQINNVETVSGGVRIAEQSASGIGVPTGGQTWAVGVFETGPGINGAARTATETRPRNVALLACIKI